MLNPNLNSDRCGKMVSFLGDEKRWALCPSCQDKRRIHELEQAIKSKALDAQISALQIQPGTVVLVKMPKLATVDEADKIGKDLRAIIPEENKIIISANDVEISAFNVDQMRQHGWVRQSAVDELVKAMGEVLRISDRQHDAWDYAKAAIAKIKGGA